MKLGFFLEPKGAASNYRVIAPMRALEQRGHEVLWPREVTEDSSLRQLASCDLVHCYRRFDAFDQLKRLAATGVAISVDNDDDFAALDVRFTDSGKAISGLKVRRENIARDAAVLRAARIADLVTTPSPVLAEKYREAGARYVATIDNHLADNTPHFGFRARHEGIVIGWVAGIEHSVDLPRLPIVEVLTRLLAKHADLRVLSVGVRLPLAADRYEHHDLIHHMQLLKLLGGVDIGIAPLADSAFNRARSNVKLKEYGSAGVMWLASPVGPYVGMGERQGGLLVEDEQWFAALEDTIESARKRRRLARRALKWAKTQTLSHFSSVWEEEFAGAIERAREPSRRSA